MGVSIYSKSENPDLDGLLNGLSIEKQDLTIVVDSGKVYLDVEAIGGGDITYYISGKKYILDCTNGSGVNGKARVELYQGTSTQAMMNIVYVFYDEDAGKLSLATSTAEPQQDFAPVAILAIHDATKVSNEDPLLFQRTTESLTHKGRGAISWEREKLRAIGGQYWRGMEQHVDITTNAGSEDNVDFMLVSGVGMQLHRQQFPDYKVSTDGIWVLNASGDGSLANNQKLTDLNEIHEIEDGTALNSGDSMNLIICGIINISEDKCKLGVLLPSGKYTNDADAVNDVNNTAVTLIPREIRTATILLARLVLKYTSTDNGTWTNLLTKVISTWHSESKDISSPNYPSNYPNNASTSTTITKTGAAKVRVHFDDFNTEANYDFVRIKDASDNVKFTYHGNLGAFTSGEVDGDTLKVDFTSDGSVTRKGFHIDSLEYATASVSGAEVKDLRGTTP